MARTKIKYATPRVFKVSRAPTAFSNLVDYDGNIYRTAIVGNQEWITTNFRCLHYLNGDLIPNITDNAAWIADTGGACCYYDNNDIYVDDYGVLYNYYAISNSGFAYLFRHGLAEAGWRIPTLADYNTLIAAVGGETAGGGALKEAGIDHWLTPNTGATNSSRLFFVGAGQRNWSGIGVFTDINKFNRTWAITQLAPYDLYYHIWTRYNHGDVSMSFTPKNNGLSVRLVREI